VILAEYFKRLQNERNTDLKKKSFTYHRRLPTETATTRTQNENGVQMDAQKYKPMGRQNLGYSKERRWHKELF
jgi:hypothetical protein